MWKGMVVGGGLAWLLVDRTADGTIARFLVDDQTAWLYVAALTAVLTIGALATPRVMGGVAGALAVGLAAAAMVTLRPASATSAYLGVPFGVGAALALGAAVLAGMRPTADEGHPVRRPWSRRARKARVAH